MKLPVTIDPRFHDAVIFDLDGVVTDTAVVHAGAWREVFDGFLASRENREGEDHGPFTTEDYVRHVDGKPRLDGITDFLAARGVTLPAGSPTDETADTIWGLANRKQQLFRTLLDDGVPAFESTVALVRRLQEIGVATAIYSSSRNCEQVLAAAGLSDLFAVRVDGVVAAELGLPGKPDPAVLVEATRRINARVERSVVVEDAVAGVLAGRDGGFSLVIGIDRTGHAEELQDHGADVVVGDLAEVVVRTGDKPMSQIPNALQSYGQFIAVVGARNPMLFFDYDGTLSEIVPDPGSAAPVSGATEALTAAAKQGPVAILSGRDLADVRARIPVPGIWYAGSHGFELISPEGDFHQNEEAAAAVPVLEQAAQFLREELSRVAGVRVEHKRFAVAIHYRAVDPDELGDVVAAAHKLGLRKGLRVTSGRKVVELRPNVDWDKGTTLSWIRDQIQRERPHEADMLPIYVGDDLTDEDAFDAVSSDGIGILVRHSEHGDRRSSAQFTLENPSEVIDFLRSASS